MRTITKITNPVAISIALEIDKLDKLIDTKRAELEQKLRTEWEAFLQDNNRQLDENCERLRIALSLPQMIRPLIDTRYADFGDYYVEHGTMEGPANPMDILVKSLSTEH